MAKIRDGSILITVIIVIAISTTLAMYIFERSTSSYKIVLDLQAEYQGAIYSMTATKALEAVFQYDRNAYDGLSDVWNMIPAIPVPNGFLSVIIKPVNAKFPLNALASKDEKIRKRYETAFETLLREKNLDTTLRTELSSWLGQGTPQSARIDESSSPYSFKSGRLETLPELQLIPAFKTNFKQITAFSSIGDINNKININMAPKEVIVAIMPELSPYISTLMTSRESADFADVSAVYKVLGGNNQELYNTLLQFFDVKSQYFYVRLELNIGDDFKYYHILFSKNGASAKPVKYIEGGNIEYF